MVKTHLFLSNVYDEMNYLHCYEDKKNFPGYDIKSYDNGKSELTKQDRKIEVKGTTNRSPRFYWSSNEVNKAKEYGEKYWIYLWTNVGTENKEIQKIQDPYKKYYVDTIEKPK